LSSGWETYEHSQGSQVQFSHSHFSLLHSDTNTSFQHRLIWKWG